MDSSFHPELIKISSISEVDLPSIGGGPFQRLFNFPRRGVATRPGRPSARGPVRSGPFILSRGGREQRFLQPKGMPTGNCDMAVPVAPDDNDRCAGSAGCCEAAGNREDDGRQKAETACSPPRRRGAAAFCRRNRYRLVGLGVFLVAVIALVACHKQVAHLWASYSAWLESHKVTGASSFIVVVALLTIICFPAAVPTLAAGAVYGQCNGIAIGVVIGTAIIFVGATLGSLVAFLLGRYAFRDMLEALNARSRWARALDAALKKNGLKVIVLMRLSPVVPYSVFNYLAACTSVSCRDFLLGSLAILPGAAMFVFLGAQSAAAVSMIGTDEDIQEGMSDKVRICILAVGVLLTLAAVVLMGHYARREIRKLMPGLETVDSTTLREPGSQAALGANCESGLGSPAAASDTGSSRDSSDSRVSTLCNDSSRAATHNLFTLEVKCLDSEAGK